MISCVDNVSANDYIAAQRSRLAQMCVTMLWQFYITKHWPINFRNGGRAASVMMFFFFIGYGIWQ